LQTCDIGRLASRQGELAGCGDNRRRAAVARNSDVAVGAGGQVHWSLHWRAGGVVLHRQGECEIARSGFVGIVYNCLGDRQSKIIVTTLEQEVALAVDVGFDVVDQADESLNVLPVLNSCGSILPDQDGRGVLVFDAAGFAIAVQGEILERRGGWHDGRGAGGRLEEEGRAGRHIRGHVARAVDGSRGQNPVGVRTAPGRRGHERHVV
jgi:hypothetical protein